jgi:hypothetical protein
MRLIREKVENSVVILVAFTALPCAETRLMARDLVAWTWPSAPKAKPGATELLKIDGHGQLNCASEHHI